MTYTSFSPEELALLRAVDNAAFDAERDGWATPTEIRAVYDGGRGQGRWARWLWDLETKGVLEAKAAGATQFVWGLTDLGAETLERSGV